MSNTRPWLKFFLSLVVAFAWWAVLHFSLPLGKNGAPPLGAFLNPYEGFYQNADVDYFTEDVAGEFLRAPVQVHYDDRLVPHVYASSEEDLYFVQGYIQAQHRLFQLDLTARSAEGTLSELLGRRTLALDLRRRRMGANVLATQMDSLWQLNPETYSIVERYAAGVNAYLATLSPRDFPIEYKLLNAEPSAWSPRRTALVAIAMAYTLNYKEDDVPTTATRALLGEGSFRYLFPERSSQDEPIIPRGTQHSSGDTALIQASEAQALSLPEQPLLEAPSTTAVELPDQGLGSNNWAVAGSKTASGKPLLANDPHLQLTLPSIWFEWELHAPGVAVHGVNLPGVPGVTIGFNRHAAWGVTNVGADVLDWHQIEYTNPDSTRYRLPSGGEAQIQTRVERIVVRGEAPVYDTVRSTVMGPVVYTEAGDSRAGLAVDWLTVKRPASATVAAFIGLNKSQSVDDFLQASMLYEWPAQNMVFANDEGDIALRISGTLPRKLPEQGRFIMTSSSARASGYLAPRENPVAINPAQGYLASTNQVSTDETYPYYYRGTFEHTRSQRINDLLRPAAGLTAEDMKRYQLDDYGVRAAELLPVLLRLVQKEALPLAARGQLAVLQDWDYRYTATSIAPVIFESWRGALRDTVWDEWPKNNPSRSIPADWRLTELLDQDPLSPWFDVESTPIREDAADVVTAALIEVSSRVDSLSKEPEYGWSLHKQARVDHLARIAAFGRDSLAVGGGRGILNAQHGNIGPSWRMVVDFAEGIKADVCYPGGQSGQPGHPHYADMVDAWATGGYYPVSLREKEQLQQLDGVLSLTFNP